MPFSRKPRITLGKASFPSYGILPVNVTAALRT
jgi:hypothetical protein